MTKLRTLIDTNVIIALEDDKKLEEEVTTFYREASKNSTLLIHPRIGEDIQRDKDAQRLEKTLSKVAKYETLEDPPRPTDEFLRRIGAKRNPHDLVDADLLYTVHKHCVNFLVTQDAEIHRWAKDLGLSEQVLRVPQAAAFFQQLSRRYVPRHSLVQHLPVHNLDISDRFFDSLRRSYGDSKFDDWFRRISREGRMCWAIVEGGAVRAICIYKEERDAADSPQIPLPTLKLATFKVDDALSGMKVAELMLKLAFQYGVKNHLESVYLTTYPANESLRYVIEDFGFCQVGTKGEELVYVKNLSQPANIPTAIPPLTYAILYYPLYLDGPEVRKFIVPIQPSYHDRLFPDCPGGRQMSLREFSEAIPEGNTIKKAYICKSKIRGIRPGDLLLFYRSHDRRELTTVGVVERAVRTKEPSEVAALVSNRTVYTYGEISHLASKGALAIIFRHHVNLAKPVPAQQLTEDYHVPGPIQSIREISHETYVKIAGAWK
jgi:hypothetical protein